MDADTLPQESAETDVVVFMRNDGGDEEDESMNDIWDDTALIKAYDKAISQAKQSNGNLQSSNSKSKRKKSKGKKKKAQQQQPKSNMWAVGDTCLAVYSEDGLVYEAVITELLEDDRCVVLYTEYGNSEEQALNDLRQFKGRSSGVARSRTTSTTCSECSTAAMNPGHLLMHSVPSMNTAHPHKRPQHAAPPSFNSSSMGIPSFIPPPPPSLPDMSTCDDEEAFHSMLISWYMSGFHTGYYQGLRDGKRHSHTVCD